MSANRELDAVVVGAGFAGLYMVHRLRQLGFTVQGLEAADDLGGTWYWNRYPGARCDIESLQYSYSFLPELDREWQWSERYATQAEILQYLDHVAERLTLRPHIQFSTRVTAASFDAAAARWTIETGRGESFTARYFILATGCLSTPREPEIPGIARFRGRVLQTSRWPHEPVELHGQRVGVIGTGSSGIQSIPIIASQARQLVVFQRTPCFCVPANNGPIDPDYQRRFRDNGPQLRSQARQTLSGLAPPPAGEPPAALSVPEEERQRRYEQSWAQGGLDFMNTFSDLFVSLEANATAVKFLQDKIRTSVADPEVAEALVPAGYPAFAKRLCVDTNYHQTFNRSNVVLVDIRKHPIVELTEAGLRTDDAAYELDTIVFATGFDAMTGAATAIDIRGPSGQALKEKWAQGPRTYLGVAAAGFPNLFLITGPGSPSVLTNVIVSIEQHVEWIGDCLDFMRCNSLRTIEATEAAEAAWCEHVRDVANVTVFPHAPSWYIGANIEGKPRVFMVYCGGAGPYRRRCEEIARAGYTGFQCA